MAAIETLPKTAYSLAVEMAETKAARHRRRALMFFWAPLIAHDHRVMSKSFLDLADELKAHAEKLGVGSRARVAKRTEAEPRLLAEVD